VSAGLANEDTKADQAWHAKVKSVCARKKEKEEGKNVTFDWKYLAEILKKERKKKSKMAVFMARRSEASCRRAREE